MNDNGPPEGGPLRKKSRQRPTLPPSFPGSTIGAGGLNFRVRDGTGCIPSAMATETAVLGEDPPVKGGSLETMLRVRPSGRARELR